LGLDYRPCFLGRNTEVVVFAETFKQYPPSSIPPSFSAYTIMEEAMKDIKAQKYIEKNVLPKVKEEVQDTSKKKNKVRKK
jgi:arylsulfatase